MTDKSKELNASICLINDKLQFKSTVGDNAPITIDYIPPFGDDMGYTSLELLLLSLSSCIGSAVLIFLRKMKKTISGFEVQSKGIRRDEHPTCFKTIFLTINLKSADASENDLKKVLELSEEKYCPVWALLKGNVEIEVNYRIVS
jgi:putative redox protein